MGFTLIEVLVSIFIISLAISGLFAVFVMGKKTIKTDKYRIKALNYAQETLEELKNYVSETRDGTYAHLPNNGKLPGDTHPGDWALADGNHTHNYGVEEGFIRTYTVTPRPHGLKQVTVKVEYPGVSP